MNQHLLRKVARHFGIQPSYYDNMKNVVWSPDMTLVKMIEGLSGLSIKDDHDLRKALQIKINSRCENGLDPCLVFWGGKSSLFSLILQNSNLESSTPLENQISIRVQFENGESQEIPFKIHQVRQSSLGLKLKLSLLANIPLGYHDLHLTSGGQKFQTFLICPPQKLTSLENEKKSWGPFLPLYALKTESDFGIGSLYELDKLTTYFKKYGAKWIGSLPLLAGRFEDHECDPSPYSALTRLFWNEIYLDLNSLVEKFPNEKALLVLQSESFIQEAKRLRDLSYVDYYGVYQLKKKVIILLSEAFFKDQLDKSDPAFTEYVIQNSDIYDYIKFRSEDPIEQRFHLFSQFQMDQQLKAISAKVPLYMDFPVGVNDSGFDFKKYPSLFFSSVSVGAPPEPVFALGQDWGFPAFHPTNMRLDRYMYFRKALGVHLRHAKLLRLDHVMGLFRIYSVPKGMKGSEGAYLRFPEEELFAICILEAQRAQADFIGENLGTVPDKVNALMKKRNIKGMWVFEMEASQNPKDTMANLPMEVLACLNTHDMPMLKTFFEGSDLDLVSQLGILNEKFLPQFKSERRSALSRWQAYTLEKENLIQKITMHLASSKSRYFLLNLEDLWEEKDPQNIPGTCKEYPNWRRKFKYLDQEWTKLPQVEKCLSYLKSERG